MADCNPNDCAVGVRVTALEKEFDRYRTNSSYTHRKMLDRIGSLEQDRASLKTKLGRAGGQAHLRGGPGRGGLGGGGSAGPRNIKTALNGA